MYTYEMNLTELDIAFKKMNDKTKLLQAVKFALTIVADKLHQDLKPGTPKDTGELSNSWRLENKEKDEIEVGFDIIYSMYQEMGRRADGTHVIINRSARGRTHNMKLTIQENLDKYYQLYTDTLEKQFFT